jgi:hypothetical protein
LTRFEFEFRTILFVLPLSLFHLENRVCLSRGVQVACAVWRAATRIVPGVGDLVQRIEDDHTGRVLGGRTIWRSGDSTCGLYHARGDEERVFLGWTSKLRSMVCHLFGLKTIGKVFSSLASKPVATISPVWPQNW